MNDFEFYQDEFGDLICLACGHKGLVGRKRINCPNCGKYEDIDIDDSPEIEKNEPEAL